MLHGSDPPRVVEGSAKLDVIGQVGNECKTKSSDLGGERDVKIIIFGWKVSDASRRGSGPFERSMTGPSSGCWRRVWREIRSGGEAVPGSEVLSGPGSEFILESELSMEFSGVSGLSGLVLGWLVGSEGVVSNGKMSNKLGVLAVLEGEKLPGIDSSMRTSRDMRIFRVVGSKQRYALL